MKVVFSLCLVAIGGLVAVALAQIPESANSIYQSDAARRTPTPAAEAESTPEQRKSSAAEEASPGEKRKLFERRDNRERIVVKESNKPAELKKLKYGADQSEGSGRFKGSMLEEETDLAHFKKAIEDHKAAQGGASPAAVDKTSPTPTPTASPRPSASP